MNIDGDLSGLASQYFKVRIWDAPATLMIYIVMAWFFGNQNAIIPLVLTIVINAVNIITSFIFVRYLHMGCLLYTSPSPRDLSTSRMPSSA